jgi:hypothetical protein
MPDISVVFTHFYISEYSVALFSVTYRMCFVFTVVRMFELQSLTGCGDDLIYDF